MEKLILFFCLLITLVDQGQTDSRSDFCFSCRDTTDVEGQDSCQSEDVGDMNDLHHAFKAVYNDNRTRFLADYGKEPLIQDCAISDEHKYCCIEEIERFGKIQSYIRGCCDGKNFSIPSTAVKRLQFISPNNQSVCSYYENKGVTICVRMCVGPFCNGPSFADSVHIFSVVVLVLSLLICSIFIT